MCCCLVYTSGTTGNSKGTMTSHDNLIWAQTRARETVNVKNIVLASDRMISYLPLSHSAGLMGDIINQLIVGNTVFYARPDVFSGTLLQTLLWARPTAFGSVPRIWEKLEERIKEIAASKGFLA